MDEMEWATWGLNYLANARVAAEDEFRGAMREIREFGGRRYETWFSISKGVIGPLYHYSAEFVQERTIPCPMFATPNDFAVQLTEYKALLQGMDDDLNRAEADYKETYKTASLPSLIYAIRKQVGNLTSTISYVESEKPKAKTPVPFEANIDFIVELARRFHEAVLSLNTHPRGKQTLPINDEWDCQYLFRALLAATISDIRDEEWNPSVAGSSARCEFYLKTMHTFVELKYVRKARDAQKIKNELARDFLDYGNNPCVNNVICLIYDPNHTLKHPAAIQHDLSGPKSGLQRVDVVISPPRG